MNDHPPCELTVARAHSKLFSFGTKAPVKTKYSLVSLFLSCKFCHSKDIFSYDLCAECIYILKLQSSIKIEVLNKKGDRE